MGIITRKDLIYGGAEEVRRRSEREGQDGNHGSRRSGAGAAPPLLSRLRKWRMGRQLSALGLSGRGLRSSSSGYGAQYGAARAIAAAEWGASPNPASHGGGDRRDGSPLGLRRGAAGLPSGLRDSFGTGSGGSGSAGESLITPCLLYTSPSP